MELETAYPRRGAFFANRFCRILHKSCAAQDIGRDACLLLVYVAQTEDAARYAGPVRFWNSQLLETMGYRSPKQLVADRQRAVDSGWLRYWRKDNRSVGYYFVTIPTQFSDISDTPMEEPNRSDNRSVIHSASGTNNGTNDEESFRPRNELWVECGSNVGSYSIPNPEPNPKEEKVARVSKKDQRTTHPPDFLEFWSVFPKGRRSKKLKAFEAWSRAIRLEKPEVIIAAAKEYAASPVGQSRYVVGPAVWLNGGCWDDDRVAWQRGDDGTTKCRVPTPEEMANWSP